jgi:hypothetical protein
LANNGTTMGVSAPKSINAYVVDENGSTVSSLGEFTLNSGKDVIYWTDLPINNVKARFVKIELTVNYPCGYINEISIYGKEHKEGIDETGTPSTNLLSGVEYDISYSNDPIVSEEWHVDYSALLTDGKAASAFSSSDGSWFFLQKGVNSSSAGVGTVTVDLGDYYDIEKARIHLANQGAGMYIYAPQYVKLYGSLDGIEYKLLGSFPIDESDTIIYWSELTLDAPETVKYLRYEIAANASSLGAYLNEIEAYGTKSDYTDAIEGDVNDDGVVDLFDYIAVKSHYFESSMLSDEELARADIVKDGEIDIFDYMQLKRLCLGL